ncbi:MAG: hypothetical protein KDB01_20450 [Planctomycetaceae bacterium]|nr:hypothetical protein [Planctomycetaceae bacterium]
MARPPIHEVRHGLIIAKIYRKKLKNILRYSVTIVRLFRNGDVWKESSRLGSADLLVAVWVLNKADSWIASQMEAAEQ